MMDSREISGGTKFKLSLLIGLLSMFYAEVFSGASPLWIINPWSLIVTFWLYLAHCIFFLNLALRTGKTSIPQLYLWGVLFGLYESWITQVVWAGYGTEGPTFGLSIGGIALIEFCSMVFFWHPILSFIMPILTFEAFIVSKNRESDIIQNFDDIIPSHLPYLSKDSKFRYFIYFLFFIGSDILATNSLLQIIVVLGTALPSIILIYLFANYYIKKNPEVLSIYSLKLNKKGFSIVTIYLILLYISLFLLLSPGRFPTTIFPVAFIIGFYIFIGIIIYLSKNPENIQEIPTNIYRSKDFFKLFIIFLILSVSFCILFFIPFLLFVILIFGIMILGIIIFIIFLIKALSGKNI
ncbi:MAG: hypothetical protein ACTSQP_03480 [Promethearchaeota archaeon]